MAILAGFSSVILVMLLGQSRVFYSMSRDGLVPKVFSEVHPTYRTPYKSNMLFFVFTALFGAFVPGDIVGEMTEHRDAVRVHPGVRGRVDHARASGRTSERGFTVPALPVVAVLGIVVCGAMIYGLGWTNWLRLLGWLADRPGLLLRLRRKHSRLALPDAWRSPFIWPTRTTRPPATHRVGPGWPARSRSGAPERARRGRLRRSVVLLLGVSAARSATC